MTADERGSVGAPPARRAGGEPTSVVIVGSGFTGFECARHLARKLLKHNASADITIISPVDYMLYTPLLPDVAGGGGDARVVAIPLANTPPRVQEITGRSPHG